MLSKVKQQYVKTVHKSDSIKKDDKSVQLLIDWMVMALPADLNDNVDSHRLYPVHGLLLSQVTHSKK